MTDLRTVPSGGHPWRAAELLPELTAAGLAEVHAVPRTWSAPVQLFAGRTPAYVGSSSRRPRGVSRVTRQVSGRS